MNLIDRVAALEAELKNAQARTADEVERFRVAMLGRNGAVTELFDAFRQVAPEEKRTLGPRMNQLKQLAQQRLEELKGALGNEAESGSDDLDLSAPARTGHMGSLHPITIVRQRIVDVFTRIGYTVAKAPRWRTTATTSARSTFRRTILRATCRTPSLCRVAISRCAPTPAACRCG